MSSLEQGEFVFNALPVESLVALMKRLALEPSRKLEGLIRRSVETTYKEPFGQAPAFYRRRRGMRKAKQPPDKGHFASDYARAVIEGMKQ